MRPPVRPPVGQDQCRSLTAASVATINHSVVTGHPDDDIDAQASILESFQNHRQNYVGRPQTSAPIVEEFVGLHLDDHDSEDETDTQHALFDANDSNAFKAINRYNYGYMGMLEEDKFRDLRPSAYPGIMIKKGHQGLDQLLADISLAPSIQLLLTDIKNFSVDSGRFISVENYNLDSTTAGETLQLCEGRENIAGIGSSTTIKIGRGISEREETMVHELIHAVHDLKGDCLYGGSRKDPTSDTAREEQRAAGVRGFFETEPYSENRYRVEVGKPKKPYYSRKLGY